MAASKASAVVKVIATPFVSVGGVIRRAALRSMAIEEGQLADLYVRHDAAGTDLAATSTTSYINLQIRLLPYRVVRLGDEISEFSVNWRQNIPNADLKGFVVTLRFAIRLMAAFMLGLMMSRQSVLPLIEPTSPLLPGIYEYHNPNN